MPDRRQEDRALRISVGYGVFAAAWVLFSDLAVSFFIRDPVLLGRVATAKGLLFVAVTGVALYSLVVTYQRAVGKSRGEAGAAEEHLREVLENLPMLVVAFDTSGSFVTWNAECERVLGYSAGEIVGDPGAMARLMPDPEYRNRVLAEWETRGNEFREWGWRMTAKDGRERIVSWSSVSESQRVPGWSVWNIGVDVTDRVDTGHRIERLNGLLHTMWEVNRLVLREEDKIRLLSSACDILTSHGGLMKAWVGLVDGAACRVLPVAGSGFGPEDLDSLDVRCDDSLAGLGPTGTSVRTGMYYIVDDTETHPRYVPWRERARQQGYRSIASFPLFVYGDCVGALSVYAREPGSFGPEDISLMEQLAGDVSLALQVMQDRETREQAEQRLRDSEQRFRTIAEQATDVIYRLRLKPGFAVEYVSPSILGVLGYTSEEITSNGGAHVTPSSSRILAAMTEGRLDLDGPVVFEWTHRDGRTVWTEDRITPIRDQDGTLVAIEGVARDITGRHLAEEAAAREREHLQAVISAAPIALLLLDPSGRIVYFNEASAQLFGCTDCRGSRVDALFEDWPERGFDEFVEAVASGARPSGVCYDLRSSDGTIRHLRISAAALDPGDPGTRIVLAVEDSTHCHADPF